MTEQLVTRSTVIHLNGIPDEVFPLFTPVGEYKWIPDWQPELIYPPSGEAMTNNVFATQHPGHARTIWVTVDYDAEAHHAEYVNITPGFQSIRIDIRCRAVDGGTEARVTHTLIAIAEAAMPRSPGTPAPCTPSGSVTGRRRSTIIWRTARQFQCIKVTPGETAGAQPCAPTFTPDLSFVPQHSALDTQHSL
ncbi:MAG: hypothetical protein U0521_08470 [Anaerolineae bacterium]